MLVLIFKTVQGFTEAGYLETVAYITCFNKLIAMQLKIPIDQQSSLEIVVFVSEMFGQNAYILRKTNTNECVLIDPSFDVGEIFDFLEKYSLKLAAILNTHGHIDHIVGNDPLKKRFPDVPLVIGEFDAHKLVDPVANLSSGYGREVISPPADYTVSHMQVISYGGLDFETRLTPGHSPGHVVWIVDQTEVPVIINGDVLFDGSVGRTDFVDGSFEDLETSIREQLYTLPDDSIVLTGHGNLTTIGKEKATNPFVRSEE